MPGSRPITTRGPAGAASSRSRRLSANTLIATFSASSRRRANRSRSVDSDSLTRQVQATHLRSRSSAGAAWRGSSPGAARSCLRRSRAGRAPAPPAAPAWPPGSPARGRGTRPARGARARGRSARRSRSSRGTWRRRDGSRPCRPPACDCSRPSLHSHSRSDCTSAGVFGPALGQDVAHAVEHGRHGGEVLAALAFFGLTKAGASAAGSSVGSANSRSASGSMPASRAIWPLVRRFGLYGR